MLVKSLHKKIFNSKYTGLYKKTPFRIDFGLCKVTKINNDDEVDDDDDDDDADNEDDDADNEDDDDYDVFSSIQRISNIIGTRGSGVVCNQL